MSLNDYNKAIELAAFEPFEALIMAAVRVGNGHTRDILREAFPDIYAEFTYRYWCSSGIMPGESGYILELDDNLPVKP